ncbi:MAG TPA: fumarylacetoacetate hydrolase family protein [Pyrinomonadaceae bacterium]|nr:fumarylacetoacetate hydrolase family protein [Pyrinomonadaceae bacterium]
MEEEIVRALHRAETERLPVDPLTEKFPSLTPAEAYSIQRELVGRKLREGARVIGRKIGLTSAAMQQALGVGEPDYGLLLDTMAVENGGTIELERLIQPKVEGEVAFVLKKDLRGPALTIADVLSATDYVTPALEIIDSRIRDWKIRLADTIADNASSGMFVLGVERIAVDEVDLPQVEMVLEKNGEKVLGGTGAAVLGNPAFAVAWLGNKLSEFGDELKAGEVILSGSLTAALVVAKGDSVTARFHHLGSAGVRFS